MAVTSNLLKALLESKIKPNISNASHRAALEEIASDLLKKDKLIPKKQTQSELKQQLLDKRLQNIRSVEVDPDDLRLEYLKDVKTNDYNKRIGQQRALDIAINRKESTPITRKFGEDELQRYKDWHQSHRGNAKIPNEDLEAAFDDIESYRELNKDKLEARFLKEPETKLTKAELKKLQDYTSKRNQIYGLNISTRPDKEGNFDPKFERLIRMSEQKKYLSKPQKIIDQTDPYDGYTFEDFYTKLYNEED